MTQEPLKGKRLGINTYTENFGGCEIPSYETSKEIDGGYFQYENIKYAVEGCLEEILEYVQSEEEEGIPKIFKKWFEDVM